MRFLGDDDSRNAYQVRDGAKVLETCLFDELFHAFVLIVADLHEEKPAVPEGFASFRQQAFDHRESILAA